MRSISLGLFMFAAERAIQDAHGMEMVVYTVDPSILNCVGLQLSDEVDPPGPDQACIENADKATAVKIIHIVCKAR